MTFNERAKRYYISSFSYHNNYIINLAGISIATLSGDNGLFKRAQQAKDATVNGQKNENAALDTYNAAINNAIKGLDIE